MKIGAFFQTLNNAIFSKEITTASGTVSPKTDNVESVSSDSVKLSGRGAGSSASSAMLNTVTSSGASESAGKAKTAGNGNVSDNKKPERSDFSTFEEYDKAYLEFQTKNMTDLRRLHPDAAHVEYVYYGCNFPPEEVFKNGIPEKGGGCFDLSMHQREIDDQGMTDKNFSAMRGSCIDARVPAKFAGTGGYVYRLAPLGGGVRLETALFSKPKVNPVTLQIQGNFLPGEEEICIGSRQPAHRIAGCFKVGEYSETSDLFRLGPFTENPGFDQARKI